ncbi:MAG TPA: ribosomal protein S18-alanine N-acetyltransferase [Mycobacteriales bacterium]|nr:ribosomal protein S18-alanine N-acetyltransferase [Mycobacteriales bacterium]
MTAVLRRLRWWDIDACLELERELFEGDAWSAELFWSELAQHESRHYVVAVDAGRVVGYAGLAVTDDEGYIQTIGVTTGAQRRGIGSALMADLMAAAAAGGATRVGLEVRTDNTGAHELYRRFGFAPVGVRRGYYQPSGADALVMMSDRVPADGVTS